MAAQGAEASDILRGAAINIAFQGVFGSIGDTFGEVDFLSADHLSKTLAHGIVAGVQSVANGGQFGHGFIAAVEQVRGLPSSPPRALAALVKVRQPIKVYEWQWLVSLVVQRAVR